MNPFAWLFKIYARSLLALLIMVWLLPTVTFSQWWQAALVAAFLIISLKIIKPILKLLTLPLSIVTLGSFSIVIHTVMFWIAVFAVPGFMILPITILGVDFGYWGSLVVTASLYSFLAWGMSLAIK
jgi:uncharacterized membrane protein YvlD (DUF360 family)